MPEVPGPLAAALADRYRLEREIGAGGMATVYLAHDLKHGRQVALKVLRPELGVIGPDRFQREVAIAARLNHPHIVPLYDSGETAGGRFYVMPYIKGETLRGRLERERQLPLEEAVGIARQVAYALAYAHAQQVVHRDIKPENILLHEGEPMVADFGIAVAALEDAARLTELGLAIGTPAYMSPEQAMGDRDLDGRSDVYALACVLFEMLAGEPPYTGPTAQSILAKALVSPVPSVRILRPAASPGLDQVLTRALARVPAERFPSAAAFAEALVAPGAGRPENPVVAVLPFRNLSADPDNEYFADGMTEDVIAHLSTVRTLDVIGRTSVMPFKGREQGTRAIAAALGAGAVLDGSVRRAGNRVRIVAQLIDARSDQQLWTGTYDRELTDIFAIQTDVALQIAAALRTELSPEERRRIRKEPTDNVQAYQLYQQGRHCLFRYTETGMQQAVQFFERAIAADPEYALAYAGEAMVYLELGEGGLQDPAVAYPKASAAVATALALDPSLPDAHCMLGYLRTIWEFDWSGAEQAFKQALALRPGHADAYDFYGRLCASMGRLDEAVAMQRRALELDPLAHRTDVANALLRAGRFAEAEAATRQALEFDPGYDRGHATLGWALIRQGRMAEGLAELEQAITLSPNANQWLAQWGQALALAGETAQARTVLDRLEGLSRERYVSPYHLAYVHTGLGEYDQAIDWLERAYKTRSGAIHGIKGSFLFAPLREHPRFAALLAKMNLA